ncbi:type III pantothenate kinase [bacterium]|nr:type III pantothenate kinase [bacterium]
MKLCIDIGNTNAKFAIFEKDKLIEKFVIRINQIDLSFLKNYIGKIESVSICCVVPSILTMIERFLFDKFKITPFVVTSRHNFGFDINYDADRIGVDRLVSMFGAKKKIDKKNILLVDIGSAITIDLLRNNVFEGGVIFPGIYILKRSLAKGAELLTEGEFEIPSGLLGQNTQEAINAGVYNGISSLINKYIAEYKTKDLMVVGTGGDIGIFKDARGFDVCDEDLVLKGLLYL